MYANIYWEVVVSGLFTKITITKKGCNYGTNRNNKYCVFIGAYCIGE